MEVHHDNNNDDNNNDNNNRTPNETEALRRYHVEFFVAMAGYIVVLATIIVLVDFDTAGGWKYGVALLPVVPALFAVIAVIRHMGRVDEMQRAIQVDGMAVGFGAAMVAAITIGFLAMAGLDVSRGGPWVIYSAGMFGWIAGAAGSTRARK